MSDADNFVRITLRIPSALHAQLTSAAARKRSMNAEIISRLESSFPKVEPAEHSQDMVSSSSEFERAYAVRYQEAVVQMLSLLQEQTGTLQVLLEQAEAGKGPLVLAGRRMSEQDIAEATEQSYELIRRFPKSDPSSTGNTPTQAKPRDMRPGSRRVRLSEKPDE